MSFAVRLDSAPAALHRRFRLALGVFALVCGTAALSACDADQRGWIGAAVAACFVFAFVAERRAGAPARGVLRIDDRGGASWCTAPSLSGDDPDSPTSDDQRPVLIERWNVFGSLAWLRLRTPGESRPFDVWLAAGDDDRRRRLRAWLAWYERGAQ